MLAVEQLESVDEHGVTGYNLARRAKFFFKNILRKTFSRDKKGSSMINDRMKETRKVMVICEKNSCT